MLQPALATCLPFCSEPQCKWALLGGKWGMISWPKKPVHRHINGIYFYDAFGIKGKVICIILWFKKSNSKKPHSQVSGRRKSSINQWMWWCPNITLVRKIIPHKLPLFSPLDPKTFITTLQRICGEKHVVSQRAVPQCLVVLFLAVGPVLALL